MTSCTWELEAVGAPPDEVEALVDRALAAESLVITRQRKGTDVTDDVRPAIVAVAVDRPGRACEYRGSRPGGAGRGRAGHPTPQSSTRRAPRRPLAPASARATSGGPTNGCTRDGARWEPLPLDATDAPHAEVRAS